MKKDETRGTTIQRTTAKRAMEEASPPVLRSVPATKKQLAADLKFTLDLVGRVAAKYIQQPAEKRSQRESHAALIVGLTGAALRERNDALLRAIVLAIARCKRTRTAAVERKGVAKARPSRTTGATLGPGSGDQHPRSYRRASA